MGASFSLPKKIIAIALCLAIPASYSSANMGAINPELSAGAPRVSAASNPGFDITQEGIMQALDVFFPQEAFISLDSIDAIVNICAEETESQEKTEDRKVMDFILRSLANPQALETALAEARLSREVADRMRQIAAHVWRDAQDSRELAETLGSIPGKLARPIGVGQRITSLLDKARNPFRKISERGNSGVDVEPIAAAAYGSLPMPANPLNSNEKISSALQPYRSEAAGNALQQHLSGQLPASRIRIGELNKRMTLNPEGGLRYAMELLNDRSDRRPKILLAAMGAIKGKDIEQTAPALLNMLDPKNGFDWQIKWEAVKILGAAGERVPQREQAIAALRGLSTSSKPTLRLAARWALTRFGVDLGPEPDISKIVQRVKRKSFPWPIKETKDEKEISKPFYKNWKLLVSAGIVLAGFWAMEASLHYVGKSPATPPNSPSAIVQTNKPGGVPPGSASAPGAANKDASSPARPELSNADRAALAQEQQAQELHDIKEMLKAEQKRKDDANSFLGTVTGALGMMAILTVPAIIFFFLIKRMQGGGPAQIKMLDTKKAEKDAENQVKRFSDVAGVEDAKAELEEIVDVLKNPEKYRKMDAPMPKGILLSGPPGTGKTLLAKAVAGEAGVPFFSMSGSEFVEMFVGVGAGRVRDLFEKAKRRAPAIIFIDELDALGKARGTNGLPGNDEREQTLNQLLVAMDGFDHSAGIVVIAATNRPENLDPALLRPGRFDRKVHVGKPDSLDRQEIMGVHIKNKRLSPDVDAGAIAQMTFGFAGAEMEGMLNESAFLSARRGKQAIDMEDLKEGINKVSMGSERNTVIPEDQKEITATHEAGHMISMIYSELKRGVSAAVVRSRIHQLTIIPRGPGILGFAAMHDGEDKFTFKKSELEDKMVHLLGGRAAEMLLLGEASTGAQNDIERANQIARDMVEKWGMSSLGIVPGKPDRGNSFSAPEYSPDLANKIDAEVKKFVGKAEEITNAILKQGRTVLVKLAKALREKESLTREEIEAIVFPGNPSQAPPPSGDINPS